TAHCPVTTPAVTAPAPSAPAAVPAPAIETAGEVPGGANYPALTSAAVDQDPTPPAAEGVTTDASLEPAPKPRPKLARKPAPNRQPNAAERVTKAVARSPKASNATIAARLNLSEATVKRHRRHAVDSVSTASPPNGGPVPVPAVDGSHDLTDAPAPRSR